MVPADSDESIEANETPGRSVAPEFFSLYTFNEGDHR